MTFNQKLKKAKEDFDSRKFKRYEKKSMIEVLEYNKQYRKENPKKYGYNADIVKFILDKESVSDDLLDYLDTEVYLSQHDIHKEEKLEQEKEMLKKGFIKFTKERLKDFPREGNAILSVGGSGMFTKRTEVKCKIIESDGEPFFLPPRNRRKGYSFFGLLTGESNSYYKLI